MTTKVVVTHPGTPERKWDKTTAPMSPRVFPWQHPGLDTWFLSVPDTLPDNKIEAYVTLLEKTPDWGDSPELEAFEKEMRGA